MRLGAVGLWRRRSVFALDIERSCDFLARNAWQVEAELIIFGHGGCGREARCAQDGLDTHSLRKLNALRYTRQFKFQAG